MHRWHRDVSLAVLVEGLPTCPSTARVLVFKGEIEQLGLPPWAVTWWCHAWPLRNGKPLTLRRLSWRPREVGKGGGQDHGQEAIAAGASRRACAGVVACNGGG